MPTSAVSQWSANSRLDPVYDSEELVELSVALKASTTYPRGQVLGELIGVSDVQVITLSATGGYFIVHVPTTPLAAGSDTGHITASASLPTAATLEDALEAVPAIGEGNVSVTGSAGGPFNIAAQNQLADLDIELTTDATNLTGGAGTATVTTGTEGDVGTPGTYAPYDDEATDGSQTARAILRYACTTDASGNITGPGEWGATEKTAPVIVKGGIYQTSELVGLDANAIEDLSAALVQGTIANGLLRL